MTGPESRLVAELRAALHAVLAADERVFLLGQDIADPYGGAFRVTHGLSTAFGDRVISTPISESAMVGVASGLALCGNKVIVEVMFGDFLGLAFDQILNVASKFVSMYGRRTPMTVVIRCPVGGGRGYGPTHSQSPQKHFIGIPHLALYELSPFHDPHQILSELLARDEPSILFEDKALYGQHRHRDGWVDQTQTFELIDGWAHAWAPGGAPGGRRVVLVATGGTATRAVAAAGQLTRADGLDVHLLVPARLYPVDLAPVLPVLATAENVWVVEESTGGGTWGAEVAAAVHEASWSTLHAPVRLIHSAGGIIPAAPHLERDVLVSEQSIVDRIRGSSAAAAGTPAGAFTPAGAAAPEPVRVPKLNTNDTSYVVVEWLVADGSPVCSGEPVVLIETSKTTEEVAAGRAGVLRHRVPAGRGCAPGDVLAEITAAPVAHPVLDTAPVVTPAPMVDAAPRADAVPAADPGRMALSAAQRQVAMVVTESHRQIPAAFALVRAPVDEALAALDRASEEFAAVGLAELLIRCIAHQRCEHPLLFSGLVDGEVRTRPGAHVAVTVDVGTGLYLPVIRDADTLDLGGIGDRLTDFRLRALRHGLRDRDLAGANIALSLNQESDVYLVQPIIPPGLSGIVSLGATVAEPALGPDGGLVPRRTVSIGLAYDHRLVNGREAGAFLGALRRCVVDPTT